MSINSKKSAGKNPVKIYGEVYGCPSNTADYERAMGLVKQAGFDITKSPEKSGLNIIFTCVVKTPTENRMIKRIQELSKLGKPLIVAGCMSKIEQRLIEKIAPSASVLGPNSIESIVDVTKKTLKGKKIIFVKDLYNTDLDSPRVRKNSNTGIIPISTGCNLNCSYCCVKFARGKLFCYPIDEIVESVKKAVKGGCKEIWITSQDSAAYNFDGKRLPDLLKEISEIPGNFTVRVGMMNPTYVKNEKLLDELIEAYKNKKIQKFLHLPLQSGSNKVLNAMSRGYTVEDFLKIVDKFRKKIPDLFLSTDIIVGFPTETENDFEETFSLLKKIKPDKVNISKFGARPGTEAAKMKQLPVTLLNERSKKLYEISNEF